MSVGLISFVGLVTDSFSETVVKLADKTAVAPVFAGFADIEAALNLGHDVKGGRGLDNALPLYLLYRCRPSKAGADFSKTRQTLCNVQQIDYSIRRLGLCSY